MKKQFWHAFSKKHFKKTQQIFVKLTTEDQAAIFSELFQKSQYANTPHSISVLFRELHEGKTFDEFHEAWFPPKNKCSPKMEHGKTYQHFFPMPIRVINAVNINNPKEIVSVGLHWLNEEEVKNFNVMVKEEEKNNANKERGDSIAHVADKKKTGIFIVETDDNLGTSF